MKKIDLISVGNLNVDITLKVDKFPEPDQEIEINSSLISPGGSASNTAVAASRLGLSVGFIGKVGDDLMGIMALEDLKRERIDISQVKKLKGIATGLVVVFVFPDGQRAMIANHGANLHMEKNDLESEFIKVSEAVHVGGGKIEVAEEALKIAKEQGKLTSFDPGSVLSSLGLEKLKKILENADLVFLNRKELRAITGFGDERGLKKILEADVKLVILKIGEGGSLVFSEEGKVEAKAFSVPVVDTTGAGDAFNAGFLASFIKERDVFKACVVGNAVAALKITEVGARSGLPTKNELNEFLNSKGFKFNL